MRRDPRPQDFAKTDKAEETIPAAEMPVAKKEVVTPEKSPDVDPTLPARALKPAEPVGLRRIHISKARGFKKLSIEQIDWIDTHLARPDFVQVASIAIFRLCSSRSVDVKSDIKLIRDHLDILAHKGKRNHRNMVFDRNVGLSYPLTDIYDALTIVHRSARALKESVEIEVSTPKDRFILFFDPEEAVVSSIADPRGISLGSKVRIRYKDTAEIKSIYIKQDASDLFAGPGFTAIGTEAPVAQEIMGLTVGDVFNFNVNGKVRGCEVLEIY